MKSHPLILSQPSSRTLLTALLAASAVLGLTSPGNAAQEEAGRDRFGEWALKSEAGPVGRTAEKPIPQPPASSEIQGPERSGLGGATLEPSNSLDSKAQGLSSSAKWNRVFPRRQQPTQPYQIQPRQ